MWKYNSWRLCIHLGKHYKWTDSVNLAFSDAKLWFWIHLNKLFGWADILVYPAFPNKPLYQCQSTFFQLEKGQTKNYPETVLHSINTPTCSFVQFIRNFKGKHIVILAVSTKQFLGVFPRLFSLNVAVLENGKQVFINNGNSFLPKLLLIGKGSYCCRSELFLHTSNCNWGNILMKEPKRDKSQKYISVGARRTP